MSYRKKLYYTETMFDSPLLCLTFVNEFKFRYWQQLRAFLYIFLLLSICIFYAASEQGRRKRSVMSGYIRWGKKIFPTFLVFELVPRPLNQYSQAAFRIFKHPKCIFRTVNTYVNIICSPKATPKPCDVRIAMSGPRGAQSLSGKSTNPTGLFYYSFFF